jgi:hypothetical protein
MYYLEFLSCFYVSVVRVPGCRSRGAGFDSRRYQIFWEIVDLERGPLSLVRIIEELLEWKSSGSGLENRDYGRGDPLCWPRGTLYRQKLAVTSPTSGGRSVGIILLRAKATEFVCIKINYWHAVCSAVSLAMALHHLLFFSNSLSLNPGFLGALRSGTRELKLFCWLRYEPRITSFFRIYVLENIFKIMFHFFLGSYAANHKSWRVLKPLLVCQYTKNRSHYVENISTTPRSQERR